MQSLSATALQILPLAGLAVAGIGLVGAGIVASKMMSHATPKAVEYPKADTKKTWESTKNAYGKIQDKIEKQIEDYNCPGRPETTEFIKGWLRNASAAAKTGCLCKNNLTFFGATGTGKTFTALDMAKKAGFKTIKMPSPDDLFSVSSMVSSKLNPFGKSPAEKLKSFLEETIKRKDAGEAVIILADEFDTYLVGSGSRDSIMQDFLEAAEKHHIPILATTNSPNSLTERIQSRLADGTAVIEFNNLKNLDNGREAIKAIAKAKELKFDLSDTDIKAIFDSCVDRKSGHIRKARDNDALSITKKDLQQHEKTYQNLRNILGGRKAQAKATETTQDSSDNSTVHIENLHDKIQQANAALENLREYQSSASPPEDDEAEKKNKYPLSLRSVETFIDTIKARLYHIDNPSTEDISETVAKIAQEAKSWRNTTSEAVKWDEDNSHTIQTQQMPDQFSML